MLISDGGTRRLSPVTKPPPPPPATQQSYVIVDKGIRIRCLCLAVTRSVWQDHPGPGRTNVSTFLLHSRRRRTECEDSVNRLANHTRSSGTDVSSSRRRRGTKGSPGRTAAQRFGPGGGTGPSRGARGGTSQGQGIRPGSLAGRKLHRTPLKGPPEGIYLPTSWRRPQTGSTSACAVGGKKSPLRNRQWRARHLQVWDGTVCHLRSPTPRSPDTGIKVTAGWQSSWESSSTHSRSRRMLSPHTKDSHR